MEGGKRGRGSSSSYLEVEETGSTISSSSGTIVSTAYTSNVSLPSTISMGTAMHFLSLGIHEDVNGNNVQVCEETGEELIRSLVQEFFGAPAANCIKVGDMSVVERWLKDLGVGWVLGLDGHAAVGEQLDRDARTWIRALGHIAQTFCFLRPLFPDRDSVGLPSICQRKGEHVGERCVPDQYHLVLFILETMSKILIFVDVLVSRDNKLITLLRVHDALSASSTSILQEFHSPTTSVEVQRIENEMAILLSAYENKLCEAIRSKMEKVRTKALSSSSSPEESSDIHKVTRYVMTYIRFLWSNYSSVVAAIYDKYVPPVKNERPLNGMIIEMVSCLQEKLASISESFPDQGLRFLFLLNNSYSIKVQLRHYLQVSCAPMIPDINHKIEAYMERYLQLSWAPLLSCLFNPTHLCLGENYSPLSKFESEFQKIYNTQKQWKVPDPRLRRRLREVITDKIIPGYKEYIQDNKVTSPKISPEELKGMLQELFEG